jgi:hypothetical protein
MARRRYVPDQVKMPARNSWMPLAISASRKWIKTMPSAISTTGPIVIVVSLPYRSGLPAISRLILA